MSNQIKHQEQIDLSIVIPIFNEEGNLEELYDRLTNALVPIKQSYEIIFVDDGSTDRSFEISRQIDSN